MSDKTMTTDELRKRLSVAVVDESAYARCLPIAEERDRLARILADIIEDVDEVQPGIGAQDGSPDIDAAFDALARIYQAAGAARE